MAEQQAPQQTGLDIELRCPVEPRILGIVRGFVHSLAREIGFSEEEIEKIEMSVDEACANVVRHAYKHIGVSPDLDASERRSPPSPINPDPSCEEALASCDLVIRVSISESSLLIQIIDHGIGVDKMPAGVTSIDEYLSRGAQGGLGVYIIREFMDEVEYRPGERGGTRLTMVKHLPTHAKA